MKEIMVKEMEESLAPVRLIENRKENWDQRKTEKYGVSVHCVKKGVCYEIFENEFSL